MQRYEQEAMHEKSDPGEQERPSRATDIFDDFLNGDLHMGNSGELYRSLNS